MFESEETSVDASTLSLSTLTKQPFMNLKSTYTCTQQALVVYIVAGCVFELCDIPTHLCVVTCDVQKVVVSVVFKTTKFRCFIC